MRVQRVLEVDAGQDREDVGLDERHQNLERVDRRDRNDDSGAIAATPANAANTLITAWPAIMLPARRIEWLTGRTKVAEITLDQRQDRTQRQAVLPDPEQLQKADAMQHKPRIVTVRNTAIAMTRSPRYGWWW